MELIFDFPLNSLLLVKFCQKALLESVLLVKNTVVSGGDEGCLFVQFEASCPLQFSASLYPSWISKGKMVSSSNAVGVGHLLAIT